MTHKQKSKATVQKSLEFRNANLHVIYWQVTPWINYSSTSVEEPPTTNAREPQGAMEKLFTVMPKNPKDKNPTANSRLT